VGDRVHLYTLQVSHHPTHGTATLDSKTNNSQ
jgi:hypothetical protein